MKKFGMVLVIGAGLFVSLNFLHAAVLLSAQPVETSGGDDFSLVIEAAEQTTPTPADEVPAVGEFHSAAHPDWPPLPGNLGYPAWNLGGNVWLLDDLRSDATSISTTKSMTLMSDDDLNPGDGGTNNDGGDYTNNFVPFPLDTNQLYLSIQNCDGNFANLSLHNGTNQVYAIWDTTNLAPANWQVETELFPTDGTDETNVLPFTVATLGRTNLFLRAEDWTGIDSDGDGVPDWWIWKYFGTINVNATNQDGYGQTLLDDYQQGQDPNALIFSVQPIRYVNTNPLALPLNLIGGTPFYMAVLVNDSDTADAAWVPYSSNVVANLNGGDGSYSVRVGLRGHAAGSVQTWIYRSLVLDTVPPVITITNPPALTVSNTTINLQGFANETLSSVTFDVGNANGVLTNQPGFLTGSADSTNYFTCPNVSLTSGSNSITVHAADLAGNTSDLELMLDCSVDTSQPGLSVLWPADGLSISGSSFTVQAQVNNPTASVSATIVDASGNTNTVLGLVEGSGAVWVKDLPLGAGTNTVTVTAGLVSGVTNTQMFTVIGNDIGLVIDPLTQFNQSFVTITGSVGDPVNDCVWVNGVQANVDPDTGDWEADGVPVSPNGTAAIKVEVYVGDPVLIGTQTQFVPQPVTVQVLSYQLKEHSEVNSVFFTHYVNTNEWYFNTNLNQWVTANWYGSYPDDSLDDTRIHWLAGAGGTYQSVGFDDNNPGAFNYQSNYGPDPSDFQAAGWSWENAGVEVPAWNTTITDPVSYVTTINKWGFYQKQTATRMQVLAPGGQAAGATNVYLVGFASVSLNYSIGNYSLDGTNFPPEMFQIGNQPLVNTGATNTSGISSNAVWGVTAVSAPAGQNVEVTPSFIVTPTTNWDYNFDMQTCQLYAPVADLNRDGQIMLDGSDTATPAQPYRFWINDASESGDISTAANAVPGSSSPNYVSSQVNGRSDLVNFFPVALCLSNVLQMLPLTNGYEYHLSQADGAVKFVYSSLTLGSAFDYLTNTAATAGYGVNADEAPQSADTITVSSTGTTLDTNWLNQIQANGGNGVILMEGCAVTTNALMLEVWHKDQLGVNTLVGGAPMHLSIDSVEKMYRWVNLRSVAGGSVGRDTDTDEPANNPDSLSDGKNLVFVHGYNVNETQARGWNAEMFKRLYQSGSKANFYAVTWNGSTSQGDYVSGDTANYQTNVVNAFVTAPFLKDFLAGLSGQTTLAGHSLGNMVCLSAINDWGAAPTKYFMIDAAVPMEAIDGSTPINNDMVNANVGGGNWLAYNNRLWASEWYNLWPSTDARSTLTWSNRLGNLGSVDIYNFYSSGEDVLRDYPGTPPSSLITLVGTELINYLFGNGDWGTYAWAWQEKDKGLMSGNSILSSNHGGWLFNDAALNPNSYTTYSVDMANAIPPSQLQTNAFFDFGWHTFGSNHSDYDDLQVPDASGSDYAAANRNRILTDAIPALTLPVGANSVGRLTSDGQPNRNFDIQANFENSWPVTTGDEAFNWHHSDFCNVAYPYTYKVFNAIVNDGNLK